MGSQFPDFRHFSEKFRFLDFALDDKNCPVFDWEKPITQFGPNPALQFSLHKRYRMWSTKKKSQPLPLPRRLHTLHAKTKILQQQKFQMAPKR
jgi:hypothetical protein